MSDLEAAVNRLREVVTLHKKKLKFSLSAKDREALELVLKIVAPPPTSDDVDEEWEKFNRGNEL